MLAFNALFHSETDPIWEEVVVKRLESLVRKKPEGWSDIVEFLPKAIHATIEETFGSERQTEHRSQALFS